MPPAQQGDTKELQVMAVMRRVLSAIIRDTTPPPGMKHPLSDRTIEDVRMCLGLITSREHEIAAQQGQDSLRPYYADQARSTSVVSMDALRPDKAGKDKASD